MPHSKNQPPHNNPYAKASSAYGSNAQKNAADPREVEARVLLKAAKMMYDIQQAFDDADPELIETTLKYNRQIWIMFYDTAIENKGGDHSSQLRSNIINLANFIFKRETEILAKPSADKFTALININREIAAGLRGDPGS